MGIRYLNTVVNEFCQNSITKKSLKCLQYNIIVVDANIYLYKFKTINKLFENYEKMLNLFLDNNIEAIFVFDGKPNQDKLKTIKTRALQKANALKKLNNLQMCDKDNSYYEKQSYYKNIATKVYQKEKDAIKKLILSKGFQCIQAVNEADEICAYLDKHVAYATLTEDMDMFVYGCSNILKNLNLETETFDLISTNEILYNLNINSHDEFKEICILAGTDYFYVNKFNIYVSLCLYMFYKQSTKHDSFLKWCHVSDLINECQYKKFTSIKIKYEINDDMSLY